MHYFFEFSVQRENFEKSILYDELSPDMDIIWPIFVYIIQSGIMHIFVSFKQFWKHSFP